MVSWWKVDIAGGTNGMDVQVVCPETRRSSSYVLVSSMSPLFHERLIDMYGSDGVAGCGVAVKPSVRLAAAEAPRG